MQALSQSECQYNLQSIKLQEEQFWRQRDAKLKELTSALADSRHDSTGVLSDAEAAAPPRLAGF